MVNILSIVREESRSMVPPACDWWLRSQSCGLPRYRAKPVHAATNNAQKPEHHHDVIPTRTPPPHREALRYTLSRPTCVGHAWARMGDHKLTLGIPRVLTFVLVLYSVPSYLY